VHGLVIVSFSFSISTMMFCKTIDRFTTRDAKGDRELGDVGSLRLKEAKSWEVDSCDKLARVDHSST
jgi:hypothetical protein